MIFGRSGAEGRSPRSGAPAEMRGARLASPAAPIAFTASRRDHLVEVLEESVGFEGELEALIETDVCSL